MEELGKDEKVKSGREKFGSLKKTTYLIIGLLALIGIWGVTTIIIMSNPIYRTLKGVSKFASKNKYEVTVGIQTNLKDRALDGFTEDIQNKLKISIDKRKKQIQGAYEIAYDGDEIIDFAMVAKEGYVYMDIPQVLDKDEYMYYELDDEYWDKETWDLIFKYVNEIDLKSLDAKPYAKAIMSATKGNVESKWNRVVFDLEGEDLVNIIENVLETAEKDDKLAKCFKKNSTKILKQMIDDKFELGDMDKKQWKEMLEEVKDKDFEDDFSDNMEELVDDFKDSASYMASSWANLEVEMTVTFDLFNNIKQIVIEPKENRQSIVLTIQNGKGYKAARKYTSKKGNDVEKIDWDDYMDILEDTVDYLEDYVKKNDKLQDVVEDMLKDSYYDNEEDLIANMLGGFLQTWIYSF